MKPISPTKLAHCSKLLSEGVPTREAAAKSSVSQSTATRLFKDMHIQAASRSGGRPRLITSPTRRHLKRIVKSGKADNLTQLSNTCSDILPNSPSISTLRRAMQKEGMKGRRKAKVPLLKSRHRQARLKFARKHEHWTKDDWARVLWSDETKINFHGSDGAAYVWRADGEAPNDRTTLPTVKFGGGNIMVWGCMSAAGVGQLIEVEGKMDAEQYVGILGDGVLKSFEDLGLDVNTAIFQQDNDPKHTSKKAQDYFKTQQFQVLEWPAQSPDLNPIEHLWNILKKVLYSAHPDSKGVYDLWDNLVAAWVSITPEQCAGLVESMPRRCEAVIKAKGGHTKY